MKYLFVLFGLIFLALFFWAPRNDVLVLVEDTDGDATRAYDDVSDLKQLIKDNFDEVVEDVSRRDNESLSRKIVLGESGVKKKPTLDAPPPPPASVVKAAGSEPGAPEEKIRGFVGEGIDPAKGTLVPTLGEPELEFDDMKYDDAEWHYGGDFPDGTPVSYGFTHIGFFLSWVVETDLLSDFIRSESPGAVIAARNRTVSPIALLEDWDGKLVNDMLTEEGNKFAAYYYNLESDSGYIPDYVEEFSEYGAYEVEPTWENFDRIKPVIDRRYQEWRARQD